MEWLNDLILLVLSATPGLAIAYYIYHQDIHEPEPLHLVLISLLFGCIAVFLSWPLSRLVGNAMEFNLESPMGVAGMAFIEVALIEEGSKFVFLRGILFRSKHFNEPFDGIVYAVMIGMGFAMMENILYVWQGHEDALLLRMFTAVPAHAILGVVMGYFLGKVSMTDENKIYFSILALASAVAMHGLYNYFLTTSFLPGLWVGAGISLAIGYYFSYRAMRIHQDMSPFKEENPRG